MIRRINNQTPPRGDATPADVVQDKEFMSFGGGFKLQNGELRDARDEDITAEPTPEQSGTVLYTKLSPDYDRVVGGGTGIMIQDSNWVPENIKAGVPIFGLEGTHEGGGTPESSVILDTKPWGGGGYANFVATDPSKEVISLRTNIAGSPTPISAHDLNFIPENVKKGVSIFGMDGEYEGGAFIIAPDALARNTLYGQTSAQEITFTVTVDKPASMSKLLGFSVGANPDYKAQIMDSGSSATLAFMDLSGLYFTKSYTAMRQQCYTTNKNIPICSAMYSNIQWFDNDNYVVATIKIVTSSTAYKVEKASSPVTSIYVRPWGYAV
jgi:hypothetical protein